MRRRDLVILLGGALITWSLAGRAQQAERVRRIGVLQPQNESDAAAQTWVNAFQKQLEALGRSEGRRVQFDHRWYGGDLNRLRSNAAELVSQRPDVILCMSTPTVAALQKATSTIPIVFVNANNPVGSGFVSTMARPGDNITGFVAFEPAMGGKWLQVLKEIAPGIKRVGLVYNPKTHTGQYFKSAEAAAQSLAIRPIRMPFGDAAEIKRSIDNFARELNGSLLVLPDSSTRVHRDLIVGLAAQHRLPAIYTYRLFITSGGLAYYGTDTTDQFRQAAEYVDRILRGAKPGELPVQAPTSFELVINLKAAKGLGLEIPPMLLTRATEVIE